MIYLDNNATTRLNEEVLETMLPYLREDYGNASSLQHQLGRNASNAIEKARLQIAKGLNCAEKEILFTSGSTEAINMIIKGIFKRYQRKGKHIITAKTEHKAVLSTCEKLENEGASITYLAVDQQGQINLQELTDSIRTDTILVTLMAANNETGIIHPIQQIAEICKKANTLFFCDATQYIGKHTLDLAQTPIDLLCMSAHKFHGPKGVGAIYVRRKTTPIQIEPLIIGGKQENGNRGGTYATAQIVGLGKAFEMSQRAPELHQLRDYFEKQIVLRIPEVHVHCQENDRLSNTSNILFKHVHGAELMTKLPGVAISSGSACVSGDRAPSHVLKAMHLTDEDALCSLRFSFSSYNTPLEVDHVVEKLALHVEKIRSSSPIWQMYIAGLLN